MFLLNQFFSLTAIGYTSLVGLALLCTAYFLYGQVKRVETGTQEMKKIANAIKTGAYTYLKRQYMTIAAVGAVCLAVIFLTLGIHSSLGFLIGAVSSSVAGIAGMMISVQANVRTAHAASIMATEANPTTPLDNAFRVAVKAGGITGCLVVGLGLIGLSSVMFYTLHFAQDVALQSMLGFALGASLISVFGRLGGGIFTKAADIGADLVGKIEANIPEDDPRNPAVIADNVGDNVGDCAGMAADVFETYVVSLIAAIQVSMILFKSEVASMFVSYILGIAGVCSVASIGILMMIKLRGSIISSLYKMLLYTIGLSTIALTLYTHYTLGLNDAIIAESANPSNSIAILGWHLLTCAFIGFAVTVFIMYITDYYTSTKYRPVRSIAKASETGHATNVIYGLSVGKESAVYPVIGIMAAVIGCYELAGIMGIAIAVTSMLALTVIIMTLDAYGPITDNAGGIAEMSHMPANVRMITDELDAVGNTTKAVTKGYAIGSAALASLILFFTYVSEVGLEGSSMSLLNPYVLVGLFVGGALPYLFGSVAMTAVGRIGSMVVMQVRQQFAERPGIMDGSQEPDYAQTVDFLTKQSISAMIFPALLPVLSPVLLFGIIYYVSEKQTLLALGGMSLGVLITGVFLSLLMTNSGGAWDNAKKYIESGAHGGKGSQAHKAAVTGDTVGDPCKDTVGPAINPMIKVIGIVILLLAHWFVRH